MNNHNIKTASNVIVIPALTNGEISSKKLKQTRVAAYCRVSTDQDEQQNSYQVQINYYTDYINRNPEWCMAGIFADKGISGTQTKNRTQFGRMIRKCRQGKIDLILCKSISRFARNTVDCLGYIRELKSLGIGVIFEKENIDTLNMTSEFIISLYGSFAQAESESISKNVTWGIEKQFREGKVRYNMSTVLGYRMGDDGKPYIVEEEAETVRNIFKMYLDGLTLNTIAEILTAKGAKRRCGSSEWKKNNIKVILRNEKYVGDAILQKTYTKDCITHKRLINYGDRTKYLIHDCHAPIVDRDTYNRVQQEITRRNSVQQKSTKTKTEQGKYSGLYALSEIMVCGECGSQYRRVTWTSHGHKIIVWRCINRLDHGNRYCKCSPSLNEEKLHNAIVGAMNEIYKSDSNFLDMIEQNIGCAISEGNELGQAIAKIENRLTEIEKIRDDLIQLVTTGSMEIEAADDKFKALNDEENYLRTQLTALKTKSENSNDIRLMLKTISEELQKYSGSLLEYDDMAVRKTIECIRVMSKTEIEIIFKGGFEMKVPVEK